VFFHSPPHHCIFWLPFSEVGKDFNWLVDKKKGALGVLAATSLLVGLAAGCLIPRVDREPAKTA
jgi:hypothetical protein